MKIPLRVDIGGGWTDVPKLSIPGAFIVNCAISPLVSLEDWPYQIGSGLGGSAAHAILTGKDSVSSELDLGVGWQDPAIILETGLCVWRSGNKPVLHLKTNPDFLQGHMGLLWTGQTHHTPNFTDLPRDYDLITKAGYLGKLGVENRNLKILAMAINLSYDAQLKEGMKPLPKIDKAIAQKYCGGGHGGYALYLFESEVDHSLLKIEPYLK
jgi:hypothetical protein